MSKARSSVYKTNDLINVKDPAFGGAKGIGVGNDGPAFQALVDTIPDETYALVHVPAGIYFIADPIIATKKYISFIGDGPNATEIRCATGFIAINNSAVSQLAKYHPISIRNMTISSAEVATGATVPTGTAVSYVGEPIHNGIEGKSLLFEDLILRGSTLGTHSFRRHFDLSDSNGTFLNRVHFLGLNGTHAAVDDPVKKCQHFVRLGSGCTETFLHKCIGYLTEYMLEITSGASTTENVKVVDCSYVKGDKGIVALGGTAINTILVRDSHLSCFTAGVKLGGTSNVSNNWIKDNLIFIRPDSLAGDNFTGIEVQGVANVIKDNIFLNNASGVPATERAIVLNNPSSAVRDMNVVKGNEVTNFKDVFISLAAGTKGNLVKNNIPVGTTPEIVNNSTAELVNFPNVIKAFPGRALPSIASASTMTLVPGVDAFRVSGATTINTIPVTYGSHKVTLVFNSTAAVSEAGNIQLAGAASFTGGADRTLTLVCNPTGGATDWFEVGRSLN